MPKYDYKCVICEYTKEIPKPISQANTVELCEKCGAAMVKQYNVFGVHFKGPGFYSTDNKR